MMRVQYEDNQKNYGPSHAYVWKQKTWMHVLTFDCSSKRYPISFIKKEYSSTKHQTFLKIVYSQRLCALHAVIYFKYYIQIWM
jgi:hypothetical protein